MRIVDAPCEYALGKDPLLQAIRIEDIYEYKDNVKTDKIVGQTLTLGLMKTFERFKVKVYHMRKKFTNDTLKASNRPIYIHLVNCRVSDYSAKGGLGLTFVADDYEIVSGPASEQEPDIDLEMEV
jgi:hypothetical protein